MTTITRYISPQTSSGSFALSILVHVSLVAAVVAAFNLGSKPVEIAEDTIELGYESFDEPPPPTQTVQHVARTQPQETVPVQKAVTESQPKELQDEKGDVAGTQVATKPEAQAASEGSGVAATTPYYRIKPKYPKAALVAGVEGWVLLQIDINEKGEVENVRVMDGEKRNMFQSEARRAVEQWKYKPYVDAGGNPIRKADRQVRVDFKLNEIEEKSPAASSAAL